MEVGKLYQIRELYWMLYPSKDIAADAYAAPCTASPPSAAADYYSKHFKCNVSYISPNSIFCLLEKDEKYCKILSTNGEVGWIYLASWCKNFWCKKDIEEVNQ